MTNLDTQIVAHSPTDPPILEIKNLNKTYRGRGEDVVAMNNMSMRMYRGDCTVVHGQSGSGKSTFLSVIGCLDRADSGLLRLDGVDVSNLDAKALALLRREKIGFIFQEYNLLEQLSLIENVMLPLLYRGKNKVEARDCALQRLMQVGLNDRLDHRPSELSGGQKQRGAIARAVVHNPPLVLADEPTGALDAASSDAVIDLLIGLTGYGHTIVIVSHDQKIVDKIPNRLLIEDGFLQKV